MLPLSWLRKFWELRAVFGVSTKWQPSFAFDKPGSLKFCGGVLLEIQSGIQITDYWKYITLNATVPRCLRIFACPSRTLLHVPYSSPSIFFFFAFRWMVCSVSVYFVPFQSISFRISLFHPLKTFICFRRVPFGFFVCLVLFINEW